MISYTRASRITTSFFGVAPVPLIGTRGVGAVDGSPVGAITQPGMREVGRGLVVRAVRASPKLPARLHFPPRPLLLSISYYREVHAHAGRSTQAGCICTEWQLAVLDG